MDPLLIFDLFPLGGSSILCKEQHRLLSEGMT